VDKSKLSISKFFIFIILSSIVIVAGATQIMHKR
jgi:hypothetical protein